MVLTPKLGPNNFGSESKRMYIRFQTLCRLRLAAVVCLIYFTVTTCIGGGLSINFIRSILNTTYVPQQDPRMTFLYHTTVLL